MKNEKVNVNSEKYEKPKIVIVEFQLAESITISGSFGPGLACGEEMFQND